MNIPSNVISIPLLPNSKEKLRYNIFSTFAKNIYSQNGEDGIIEELLKRLNIQGGWACEFGAWDGIFLSNCYNLILNKSFKGLLIEGNEKRFIVLKKNLEKKNVILVNKYVAFEGPNSVDNILESNNFNIDF